MSTIKSSNEHLTLNADGSSKDIKFQANGVEKASISSAGAFTSTTIDATKLTGDLPAISGANLTGVSSVGGATGVDFNDNVKARFGTGNDLEIYHDGSHSRIKDVGTGNLYITGANQVNLQDDDGEPMINCVKDGAVNIMHNGFTKFSTTATGTTVTRGKFTDGIEITDGTTEHTLHITSNSQDHNMLRMDNTNTTSTQHSIQRFYRNGTLTGSIQQDNNSTQFVTSSDHRLKENVDYTWDATTRLKQLKPARFNFIADDTKTVDGFIAHEVSSVVPEAISGEKDAVDSDGNIEPQGIDQSKLVPLLVKTIQELEARITALEA